MAQALVRVKSSWGLLVCFLRLQLRFGNSLPFGDASLGMRRFNPLPYSPILTRFDQDGDGDFDMDDIRLMREKKKAQNEKPQCVASTKSGDRCKRRGDLDDKNLCYLHRKDE